MIFVAEPCARSCVLVVKISTSIEATVLAAKRLKNLKISDTSTKVSYKD